MSQTQVFKCPSCGAPLNYEHGAGPTIECPYCDASVIVPAELRGGGPAIAPSSEPSTHTTPRPPIQVDLSGPARIAGRSCGFSVVAVLIAVLALGAVGVFLIIRMTSGGSSAPAWAQIEHTFGGEGTGPGLFTDARHIAIDGEGNIYVGEYSDGRIQVFDATGEFTSLWMVDNDTPLRSLAADRQGIVYVVQGGEMLRYQGATGELLGKVEYAAGDDFDDVAVTADGGLVASWRKFDDDIIRLNPQGQVVWIIKSAISGQTGDAELDARVAVDGLGTVYVLGHFNSSVFQFSPGGKFENRFGSQGHEPGQFSAPHAIAVDGQGRVYVGDAKGIQVFGADGRYLDLIKADGPAFGMAFKDNELYVAARTQVDKYVLQQ